MVSITRSSPLHPPRSFRRTYHLLYRQDLLFYYTSSYPSPFSIPFGAGYLTELVARLTHSPIKVHNTSTNSTLDGSEVTFPLNDKVYVDATHDVVLLYGVSPVASPRLLS